MAKSSCDHCKVEAVQGVITHLWNCPVKPNPSLVAPKDKIFHGWILVEKGDKTYRDTFVAEWRDNNGTHRSPEFYSPSEVVEFWDKKIGKPVSLLPALRGSYRVYTAA
jgi:hypothetical protein